MTKVRNQRIWNTDHDFLRRVAEDFEFIGRPYKLDLANNLLTVFALPQRKPKKKKNEKTDRNKRAESAARRA